MLALGGGVALSLGGGSGGSEIEEGDSREAADVETWEGAASCEAGVGSQPRREESPQKSSTPTGNDAAITQSLLLVSTGIGAGIGAGEVATEGSRGSGIGSGVRGGAEEGTGGGAAGSGGETGEGEEELRPARGSEGGRTRVTASSLKRGRVRAWVWARSASQEGDVTSVEALTRVGSTGGGWVEVGSTSPSLL